MVETLRKSFRIPASYRAFLLEADPLKAETVTPVERVRLFSSSEIAAEQVDSRTPKTVPLARWTKTASGERPGSSWRAARCSAIPTSSTSPSSTPRGTARFTRR